MPFPYEEFDLSGVRTYPLAGRRSKARTEDFAALRGRYNCPAMRGTRWTARSEKTIAPGRTGPSEKTKAMASPLSVKEHTSA